MLSELKASVIGSLLITLPLSPSLKKKGRKKKGGKKERKKERRKGGRKEKDSSALVAESMYRFLRQLHFT